MAIRKEMEIDPAAEAERIAGFVRSELEGAGRSRIVLGISGGLDSATVALLCAQAVGPDNVLGFILPYRTSTPESAEHARAVAASAGIGCESVDISPAVDALRGMLPTDDRVRLGNLMARTRMIVLYDRSALHDALVAGTGNHTETLLGYATLHGDSACAFAPIAHLYKCQVRQLAAHLGVPEDIIAKPPSADLWQGQTDEGELGFAYDDIDWLLFNLLDAGKDAAALRAMGFDAEFIDTAKGRIAATEFKRRMPRSL